MANVGQEADARRVANPAQVAIRWVLDHPAITSAVVGVRTIEQLEDAVRAAESEPLTGAQRQELRAALKVQRYEGG